MAPRILVCMSLLPPGLHETIITSRLNSRIQAEILAKGLTHTVELLRTADAPDRLAAHVETIVRRAINDLSEEDRVRVGTDLVRKLLDLVGTHTTSEVVDGDDPVAPPKLLRQISHVLPDGTPAVIDAPLISLLDTTLLTNAPGEPVVGRQIASELASADQVDIVMAFIRWSGVQPFETALRSMALAGKPIRILTTTYTNSTEARALELLIDLGAEVRVSYDLTNTRLHAKAWIFHRKTGFSTAYIGSSNLTFQAQQTGLEWNVRVSGARNRGVFEKMASVFETYWASEDFVSYDRATFLTRTDQSRTPQDLWPTELRLQPFQERLLHDVEVSRRLGFHRNLLVSATGTGKTVMAAIDYARLREHLPRARLLFVAHREEILTQARKTYQIALSDPGFGELWVGGQTPRAYDHVFASIQNLHAGRLANIDADHYDVVVIDEFHHAAAETYQALLQKVSPRELLGMTATPERSDGLSILDWFGNRIAAELRLWDAISQQRLAPFHYYGINDTVADYTAITWRRGTGYDITQLSNLLTGNDLWANLVVRQLQRRSPDVSHMRALGFCVSVDHAQFMARAFTKAGISAVAVWASTPDVERAGALRDLRDRKVQVIFSVDLFNEGIDVPAIDTVLMLRPTDSPVLFLQQLGRGLRLHHGKTHCLVLDFVGQHRKEFRFDRRFRAILGGSRQELIRHIEQGFPFLPSGCFMELDRIASDRVLDSINRAIPRGLTGRVAELRAIGRDITLADFLAETGLDLEDVYGQAHPSWSELRQRAGLPILPAGLHEVPLRRALGRLLHIDDPERLGTYRDLFASPIPPRTEGLTERHRRLIRMLVVQLFDQVADSTTSVDTGIALLWDHPQVVAELRELVDILARRQTHLADPLTILPNAPLRLHASYSRTEILAAFGVGSGAKPESWREGVRWVPQESVDFFVITADKTEGQFSPTTRYRDYAISRDVIHWESQSLTRAESPTGLRYQRHVALGSHVLFFARHSTNHRAFLFLGPATYVSHESERPMQITWRLDYHLPPDVMTWLAVA